MIVAIIVIVIIVETAAIIFINKGSENESDNLL